MSVNNFKNYSEYLQSISLKAKIYRNLFYFPKLSKYLEPPMLEIGCGIGGFLQYNKNQDIIGVDINPKLIQICINQGLNAKLMEIDSLPFNDEQFSSILIDNVLEHILDPSKLLKEVYRVSKINAKIVISVPGLKGYEYDDDHKKFYDKKILNDTLHKFGYKFVKDFYTPFKSELLNRNMRQYCMHGVYKKIND